METQNIPQAQLSVPPVQSSKNWNSTYLLIIVFGIVLVIVAAAVVFYTKSPKSSSTTTTTTNKTDSANPFVEPTAAYQNPFDQTNAGQSDATYQNPFSNPQ